MTKNVDVIDVSHHQQTVNFEKVKESGVVGVILKATEGTGVLDKTFAGRYMSAQNAGLQVSSYHFLRPGNVAKQMDFYRNVVKPRRGERVVIDHEDERVHLEELVDAVQILLNDERGLQVTVYSGHLIKEQLANTKNDILAQTSLWLAQYGPEPSWPKGTWPTWTLWQYSDQGAVPGVSGNCDVNHFNGSAENCERWMTPASEIEPGTAPTEPTPVPVNPVDPTHTMMDLTFPLGSTVVIKVNGVFWAPNPNQ